MPRAMTVQTVERDGPTIMSAPDDGQQDLYATEQERRQAIAARSRAADGVFVYAVRTTGVYCRPSCPARPARPENIAFYATGVQARAAGYRACKRCHPDEDRSDAVAREAVTKTARMIDDAIASGERAPGLARLAVRAGYSPFHFHRLFKGILGLTPKAYADAARARTLRETLSSGASVTHAIHDAGYSSASRFYRTAKARLGMSPSSHRRGAPGLTIRFAIASSSLGFVLVAGTSDGICAILLGDDPVALADDLETRFGQANFVTDDTAFDAVVSRVVAHVERPGDGHDLPVDLRGTAFQERVWRALQAVPAGETATYTDIARAIGAPASVRAVAGACGANPLAVLVPCHRILRSDGAISGYRWGVDRKIELLRREAQAQLDQVD